MQRMPQSADCRFVCVGNSFVTSCEVQDEEIQHQQPLEGDWQGQKKGRRETQQAKPYPREISSFFLIESLAATLFLSDARQPEVSFSSPLIRLDATKFAWLNVFTLIKTICPKVCSKSWLKSAKSPLPVDVRRSKTWLACKQALLFGRAKRCSQTKTSLLKFPHFPKRGKTSSSKTNQMTRDTQELREG